MQYLCLRENAYFYPICCAKLINVDNFCVIFSQKSFPPLGEALLLTIFVKFSPFWIKVYSFAAVFQHRFAYQKSTFFSLAVVAARLTFSTFWGHLGVKFDTFYVILCCFFACLKNIIFIQYFCLRENAFCLPNIWPQMVPKPIGYHRILGFL